MAGIPRRATLALFAAPLVIRDLANGQTATGRKKTGKRLLILCTGNSARSQMTEGFFRHWDGTLEVYSAGTQPSPRVNPYAIRAMKELGIDIGGGTPKKVDQFVSQSFDFVFTVCDDADATCPRFSGKVGKRMHIGFPDPAKATGTDDEIMAVFRRVRDDIQKRFRAVYEGEVRG
ncbi:MAG: arsenate reductase ArsC [Bryobacterales bacterium]|jgi:arsenate reductase|nr:arsenate reductase ArsC [Bryobacterales bacterium]